MANVKTFFACHQCKKIPLKTQMCNECGVVTCEMCQNKYPENKCQACDSKTCGFVEAQESMKKGFENLVETHSCATKF